MHRQPSATDLRRLTEALDAADRNSHHDGAVVSVDGKAWDRLIAAAAKVVGKP